MADDKKKLEDNIGFTKGTKDESKTYVFTPFNYRSAQAAIKEAGGTWKGSLWEIDTAKVAEVEPKIREAAREDIALGKEGRKAREEELKANKPAKTELSEEEKAAKAEAGLAAAKERDKTRLPVVEGSVSEGDTVSVGGEDVAVTKLGTAWELDTDEKVAGLKERFPEVEGIEKGAKVQFASFEAPEEAPAGPGM
ncbi:hypothetical protein KUV57_12030 [Epibacterium sp. DP7N7-1]|nr:hypothetical protein [Epibacterium sp. DP7N7-1]